MILFKDVLTSSDGNVKKYIFEDESALVEAVLYKYPDYETRTTICISVQSGCKVGCTFCGTGKKFLRNLTSGEIVYQVASTFAHSGVPYKKVKKLQIMFMSMGEPSHNREMLKAMESLSNLYPNAQLLVSTIGTNEVVFYEDLLRMSTENSQIGLQFSIHHFDDKYRDIIIPYEDKMSLDEIAEYGIKWSKATGRLAYCNYVVTNSNNKGYERLFDLFPPEYFAFTFSVLCSPNENMKSSFYKNKDDIKTIHDDFLNRGYNVRVFDPSGQDDIGGGCGQLWYFQNKIKELGDDDGRSNC